MNERIEPELLFKTIATGLKSLRFWSNILGLLVGLTGGMFLFEQIAVMLTLAFGAIIIMSFLLFRIQTILGAMSCALLNIFCIRRSLGLESDEGEEEDGPPVIGVVVEVRRQPEEPEKPGDKEEDASSSKLN